ncbi:antitoxin [Curtobacterium sp. MCJR17_055]|uniref:Rv0909 family putative TA system antitoxin n=1 Tax=unclassified Curtobacterium TaxID=257496 RepID=UPI000D88F4A5|nr:MULTISPECIES: Rv0909 family putative TA system antitoxin [unclassified Curtobacterium]PYY36687.1 antitoxin [Curtobacterium sp. MCBD17_029]PYY39149.1 antitoxin [Curtobacterium sp. MCPF17_046]PYY48110.1 antitoxin [Curtobacterium sp. MCBD17_023]PYY58652.1 antitoxin [Curtobacterium sp. MCJR17_055]PYY59806.1 antitoxin [Curtobacterium sp. MCPF17_015]
MSDLSDKAKDFANSDKGEKATDAGLDKAAGAADKATGGSHGDQIDKAENAADGKIGN